MNWFRDDWITATLAYLAVLAMLALLGLVVYMAFSGDLAELMRGRECPAVR